MYRLSIVLVCGAMVAACSSDNGSDSDSGPGPADTAGQDTFVPGNDTAGVEDLAREEDSSPTQDGLLPDKDVPVDTGPAPAGDKQMGEMCQQDAECQSGLCWASDMGSGCTMKCKSHLECQVFGLVCVPRTEGVAVCALPPAVGGQCGTHQECMYPTACLAEFSWCDLPECTWDGDCPAGQECEQGVRKCQPVACNSTYECKNPARFCFDGDCLPPECTSTSQCEIGQICSFAQGFCTDATPCNEEGKCNYYNQLCVDGLCEPNLCTNPCSNASYQCNHKTGKCGAVCQTAGQCPAGQGCDGDTGICYENLAPLADPRVLVGGELKKGGEVPAGATVTLDGSLSQDPEGFALTYSWMVISKPPGLPVVSGTVFCQSATCQLDVTKGVFVVGLWVKDAVGAVSIQSAIGILAK